MFIFQSLQGKQQIYITDTLCEKVSKYGVFSGPYFPVFGLNTEIYFLNFRIQAKYRKIRTTKNSIFGHFSRSDIVIECFIHI